MRRTAAAVTLFAVIPMAEAFVRSAPRHFRCPSRSKAFASLPVDSVLHLQSSNARIPWPRDFEDLPVEQVYKLLVQKGIEYAKQQQHDDAPTRALLPPNNNSTLVSPWERAPACISNLQVRTLVTLAAPINATKDYNEPTAFTSTTADPTDSTTITIQGTSDSHTSRGLIAVLAAALQSQSARDVLQLDATRVAHYLNLQSALLSSSRNDGLASIVRTVQKQIATLINNQNPSASQNDTTSSSSSISSPLREASTIQNQKQPTVALLLSGGVDSSVALALLKQNNYNVTAFYLKIWLQDELAQQLGTTHQCPWEDDIRTCRAVCNHVGVPLVELTFQKEYEERVMSYTLQEARMGRTPNPDIMCNSRIKFGCFYDNKVIQKFDYVATGHYAQVQDGRLLRGPDAVKDQSYFLCTLTAAHLQRVLFPIGHLQKHKVRELAHQFELPNQNRPDSQGLCFLGKVKFDEFLRAHLGQRPGSIVDAATGHVIGTHHGVWYHTIGQRKGIGKVLDPIATSRGPWYVVAKDIDKDVIFCSNDYDESAFTAARSQFAVENIHWISGHAPVDCQLLSMKLRHGTKIVQGKLLLTSDDGMTGDVHLTTKDGGLAPGQYCVFYRGEECLGGGVISERHWTRFLQDREAAEIVTARNSTQTV
jgi:tRNA (5-methylaminomethyl-2-thiouridylate)-methyltransferase